MALEHALSLVAVAPTMDAATKVLKSVPSVIDVDNNDLDIPKDVVETISKLVRMMREPYSLTFIESEKKLGILFPQCNNLHRLLLALRGEARTLDGELIAYYERKKELEDQIAWVDDASRSDAQAKKTQAMSDQIDALTRSTSLIDQHKTLIDTLEADADLMAGVSGELSRIGTAGNKEMTAQPNQTQSSYVQSLAKATGYAWDSLLWRDWLFVGESWRVGQSVRLENKRLNIAKSELDLRKSIDYTAALNSAVVNQQTILAENSEFNWRSGVLRRSLDRHNSQLSRISKNFAQRYAAIMLQYIDVAQLLRRQSRILFEALKDLRLYNETPMPVFAAELFCSENDESLLSAYGRFLTKISLTIDAHNATATDTWIQKNALLVSDGKSAKSDWIDLESEGDALLSALALVCEKPSLTVIVSKAEAVWVYDYTKDSTATEERISSDLPCLTVREIADSAVFVVSGGLFEEQRLPIKIKLMCESANDIAINVCYRIKRFFKV